MSDRIKEIHQYSNGWQEGVPIGADAENIDVDMGNGVTKDLQQVLGTPTNIPIQTQINNKINGDGGDISNTIIQSTIEKVDTDDGYDNEDLISQSPDDNEIVATAGDSPVSLWGKFNKFRKRVNNKFTHYLQTSIGTGAGYDNYHGYSAAALNTYFNNVIGYTSSTTPSAGPLTSQLNTLKSDLSSTTTRANGLYNRMFQRGQITPGSYYFGLNNWRRLSVASGTTISKGSEARTGIKYTADVTNHQLLDIYATGGIYNRTAADMQLLVIYHIAFTSNDATKVLYMNSRIKEATASGYEDYMYVGTFREYGTGGNPIICNGATIARIPSNAGFILTGGSGGTNTLSTATSSSVILIPLAFN